MSLNLISRLILSPLTLAFIISFAFTPLTVKLAWKLGLVDNPRTRKHPAHLYRHIIPRAGGLPIYIGIIITSLVFLPPDRYLIGILIGAGILVIAGLLDDRYDINPYARLAINFVASGVVVLSGINITFITNPFGGVINLPVALGILLAILWIATLTNIVNWAKGFDGQLPGTIVIASITIALFSLRYSADITQWPIAILAAITAGAYLGFLPFNFYPQRIMPGYSGGALAGFMISVLTILSTSKILTGMVVLGIPVIDAVYSIIRRISAGKSPVWGDRGHLHHQILDRWHWGKRKAAYFYWLITMLLGILALTLNSRWKFYTIIMLAVIIGGLLLWFDFLKTYSDQSGQDKRSKI